MLLSNPYGPREVSIEVPEIDDDPEFLYKFFAVWMYEPELLTVLFQYEEEFEQFPLSWLSHLPAPAIRYLDNEYKGGTVHDEVIVQQVNEDSYLTDLAAVAKKLPPLNDRSTIISEITANYVDNRYASVINLVLPQIEYQMWLYAAFIHRHSEDDILSILITMTSGNSTRIHSNSRFRIQAEPQTIIHG